MSDLPIIDPQAIENLRSLNPDDNDEFVREIAGIFLDDTPQRIAELEVALVNGDIPKFTRAAHSIKGSSSNMGAMRLREISEAVEQKSKNVGLADGAQMIAEIKVEYEISEAELRRLIKL